jgi:hypothetical protein
VPHGNPLSIGILVHVEERGQPSSLCKGEVSKCVRQSSLQFDDAICGKDESYEATKICEVNGINIEVKKSAGSVISLG